MPNRIAMGMPICPLCQKTISKSQALCGLAEQTEQGLVHKDCLKFPVFAPLMGQRDYNIK